VLIDMFGPPADRRLARLGYYVAFPGVVLSGLLLTVDLRRPERFWHMLLQSETLRPMFKPWSPMSVGSWALLAFGAFAFVGFLAALAESGRLRWSWLTALRPPRPLGAGADRLRGIARPRGVGLAQRMGCAAAPERPGLSRRILAWRG